MDSRIIEKYNVPVPRYTSYPPANFFDKQFGNESYDRALVSSNTQEPHHISFYFHIPFCRHMCHYCGCNSYPIRNRARVEEYMSALREEMKRVFSRLDHSRKVSQIHYGGGTPTVLSPETLKSLNDSVFEEFETIEHPEIAIECHPGYLDARYWESIAQAGFNRVSIGIQDFDQRVLQAVHRQPSLLPVEEIFSILRAHGISINLDFIYGLPLQTADGFENTIHRAASLSPDRIVTFSYAHVPWVNPAMKQLELLGLPGQEEKREMFLRATRLLQSSGYHSIGLDHFVREEDELYDAFLNKQLHRNFQGYCTRRTTGQVYAFGVSGISQLSSAYAQNTKDIDGYIAAIQSGKWAVERGYELSPTLQLTREVITRLMCNERIVWQELADFYHVSPQEIISRLSFDRKQLESFEQDGILICTEDGISMTPEGQMFVRNAASIFDPLYKPGSQSYSKPL